jgi:hypothetical protein
MHPHIECAWGHPEPDSSLAASGVGPVVRRAPEAQGQL